MGRNTTIAWTHNTFNPWVGCDKIAPECDKCYIFRDIRKQKDWQGGGGLRQPWGKVYLTKTFHNPYSWQRRLERTGGCERVFTCRDRSASKSVVAV